MPITQPRFHRLLEAGEQYRQVYQSLHTQVAHECALYHNGRKTLEEAISAISAALMAAPDYLPADAVLIEERTRYQYTYRKNLSEKGRLHEKRLLGAPPRKTRVYTQMKSPPPLQPVSIPETWMADATMSPEEEQEYKKFQANRPKRRSEPAPIDRSDKDWEVTSPPAFDMTDDDIEF